MSEWDDFTESPASRSGQLAFERAGVTPDDIDICQIYDAFTSMVLLDARRRSASARRAKAARSSRTASCASAARCPPTPTAAACRTATPACAACSCSSRRSRQLRGEAARPPGRERASSRCVNGTGGWFSSRQHGHPRRRLITLRAARARRRRTASTFRDLVRTDLVEDRDEQITPSTQEQRAGEPVELQPAERGEHDQERPDLDRPPLDVTVDDALGGSDRRRTRARRRPRSSSSRAPANTTIGSAPMNTPATGSKRQSATHTAERGGPGYIGRARDPEGEQTFDDDASSTFAARSRARAGVPARPTCSTRRRRRGIADLREAAVDERRSVEHEEDREDRRRRANATPAVRRRLDRLGGRAARAAVPEWRRRAVRPDLASLISRSSSESRLELGRPLRRGLLEALRLRAHLVDDAVAEEADRAEEQHDHEQHREATRHEALEERDHRLHERGNRDRREHPRKDAPRVQRDLEEEHGDRDAPTIASAERSDSFTAGRGGCATVRGLSAIDSYDTDVADDTAGPSTDAIDPDFVAAATDSGAGIDLDPRSAIPLAIAFAVLAITVWFVRSVPRTLTALAIASLLALALNPLVEALQRRTSWPRRYAAERGAHRVLGRVRRRRDRLVTVPTIRSGPRTSTRTSRTTVNDLERPPGHRPAVARRRTRRRRCEKWLDELPDRLSVNSKPVERAAAPLADGTRRRVPHVAARDHAAARRRAARRQRPPSRARVAPTGRRSARRASSTRSIGRYIAGSLLVAVARRRRDAHRARSRSASRSPRSSAVWVAIYEPDPAGRRPPRRGAVRRCSA